MLENIRVRDPRYGIRNGIRNKNKNMNKKKERSGGVKKALDTGQRISVPDPRHRGPAASEQDPDPGLNI